MSPCLGITTKCLWSEATTSASEIPGKMCDTMPFTDGHVDFTDVLQRTDKHSVKSAFHCYLEWQNLKCIFKEKF